LSYDSILKTFGETHERTLKAKQRLDQVNEFIEYN
jgi:hypothetical protein